LARQAVAHVLPANCGSRRNLQQFGRSSLLGWRAVLWPRVCKTDKVVVRGYRAPLEAGPCQLLGRQHAPALGASTSSAGFGLWVGEQCRHRSRGQCFGRPATGWTAATTAKPIEAWCGDPLSAATSSSPRTRWQRSSTDRLLPAFRIPGGVGDGHEHGAVRAHVGASSATGARRNDSP